MGCLCKADQVAPAARLEPNGVERGERTRRRDAHVPHAQATQTGLAAALEIPDWSRFGPLAGALGLSWDGQANLQATQTILRMWTIMCTYLKLLALWDGQANLQVASHDLFMRLRANAMSQYYMTSKPWQELKGKEISFEGMQPRSHKHLNI